MKFCISGDTIKCELCHHYCSLLPDRSGLCKVRFNRNSQGELPYYGFITAIGEDPIEKKPLYHFRPGSSIFSAGFTGCNFRCPFCQNWHISQSTDAFGHYVPPRELINCARESGNGEVLQIAYTYSEPLVHIEYLMDCMTEGHKHGVANILVTNGCINSAAAKEVLSLADAVNVDLKCFSRETYSKVLGGDLDTVLNFIRTAFEKGVHVELTTLVIPDLNDSEEELASCMEFISGLKNGAGIITGKSQVPWHLSAYHPDWKWKAPPTSPSFLAGTAVNARNHIAFVYTGNIPGETNDTACLHCGKILVRRHLYNIDASGLTLNKTRSQYLCANCGNIAPFRL